MATGNYYVPSSNFKLDGGGNSGDFVASIVCSSFNDHGHVNIHYDGSIASPITFPPSIIQSPTSQIVEVGSDATFNVNASDPSVNYQWYFFATTDTGYWPYTNLLYDVTNEIPGATNSSLDITNVQSTNVGYFGVVVSNLDGFARSWPANLTVYSDATPVLSGALNPTNGQFQLNISGVTGLNYILQASTNLVDWVPLWTNTSPFSFAETNMPAYPQRFYRSAFIP